MTGPGSGGDVGAPTNEVMVEVFGVPYWTSISFAGLTAATTLAGWSAPTFGVQ